MLTKHEVHHETKRDSLCPFIIHPWVKGGNLVSNWHSNVEVICTLWGELTLQYDDETMTLNGGDISVVGSNALHRVTAGHTKEYHCIIIDSQFCKENGIDTDGVAFEKKFVDSNTHTLCCRVAECYNTYVSEPKEVNVAKLRAAVLLLLIDIFENHRIPDTYTARARNNTSEQYVKNVISYLAGRYMEKVTLDGLAEMCGVTKCHLSREFKKYTGQTVMTYLNLLRCKNAQRMIRDGSSITEAAINVGFDDLSYFSKTYKRLIGTTPTEAKGG